MGLYLDHEKLGATHKADKLIAHFHARELTRLEFATLWAKTWEDIPTDVYLVIVVNNFMWDAALVVTELEWKMDHEHPDHILFDPATRYLLVPTKSVHEIVGATDDRDKIPSR